MIKNTILHFFVLITIVLLFGINVCCAEISPQTKMSTSVNHDMQEKEIFTVNYETTFDRACTIAQNVIRECMGGSRLGCRGAVAAVDSYQEATHLYDALRTFNDAIIYWQCPSETRDYLFSEDVGSKGVIPFFLDLQETDGEYLGNIPIAKWTLKAGHGYEIESGGGFDLVYKPRRNLRDDLAANAELIATIYRYWKFFDDTSYFDKFYNKLLKYVDFRASWLDPETSLFQSSLVLGDVAPRYAIPRSCATVYNNAECMRLFQYFSELAKAVDKIKDAKRYAQLAYQIKRAMNQHLWDESLGYYRVKIFTRVTEDENSPLYNLTNDDRFYVGDNIVALAFGIPDTLVREEKLVASIERVGGLKGCYGTSVLPPYPNGYYHKRMDNHCYWNGDIWPVRGTRFAVWSYRNGYPELGWKVIAKQANLATRDNGFCEFYEGEGKISEGLGASQNAFTAAPYMHAVIEGLFGLVPDYPNNVVYIHPSLTRSGRIQCRLGMHTFDFKVEIDQIAKFINMAIDTTYSGQADFCILLPNSSEQWEVYKQKQKISSKIKKKGNAAYLVFDEKLNSGNNDLVIICNRERNKD